MAIVGLDLAEDSIESNPWASALQAPSVESHPRQDSPLESCDEIDVKDVRSGRTDADPIGRLPVEIFDMITAYVAYPEILNLKLVSRAWCSYTTDYIKSSHGAAYRYLDFRAYSAAAVSPAYLASCIAKSGGSVQQISVKPCSSQPGDLASLLRSLIVFQHSSDTVSASTSAEDPTMYSMTGWGPDPATLIETAAGLLDNVRVVSIDDGFSLCLREWKSFGTSTVGIFSRLVELQIPILVMPDLFEFLGSLPLRCWLPKLEVLECHFDERLQPMLNHNTWPDLSSVGFITAFVALPSVRRFTLGDTPKSLDGSCPVDQRVIDIAIRWMPNLEKFSCRGITVAAAGNYGFVVPSSSFRLSRKLTEFEFSYGNVSRMPALPGSCKKLVLRNAGVVPRTLVYHEGEPVGYAEYLTHPDDLLPSTARELPFHMRRGPNTLLIANEYGSLEVLDLSGPQARLTGEVFCNTLALCSPNTLRELSVQSCPRLVFTAEFTCGGGPARKTVMDWIVERAPMLEVLRIGGNDSMDDKVVAQVLALKRLRYLDISRTRVTDTGLERLRDAQELRMVVLGQCLVSADGIAKLRGVNIEVATEPTNEPKLFI